MESCLSTPINETQCGDGSFSNTEQSGPSRVHNINEVQQLQEAFLHNLFKHYTALQGVILLLLLIV